MIRKSMVTTFGVTLFLSAALTGGCGSSDDASVAGRSTGLDASTGLGACDPTFCPGVTSGFPCCVEATQQCGVDYGSGCIATGAATGTTGVDAG